MDNEYDAIIIGAGHNGLVAAAYLAKSGRKVLVLERRNVIGGAAATEEIFPGFQVNTGAEDSTIFRDSLFEDLNLQSAGLEFRDSPVALFCPQPDGRSLTLWSDEQATVDDLAQFSKQDADRFPAFRKEIAAMAKVVSSTLLRTPPNMVDRSFNDIFSWGTVALKLKQLGKQDMMSFLRVLPMPVKSYLDEWFESDALKGALGAAGIVGLLQGPRASGTTLMMLYQNGRGLLSYRQVVGGMGQLPAAIATAAERYGAIIRTGVGVARLKLENDNGYRASGVSLDSGEEITAKIILSNANPKHTLFDLVGPQHLDPSFMRQVRNIMFRGSTAKVNLALGDLPEFNGQTDKTQLGGRIRIGHSLDYLEKAYDAAKYGRFSPEPYLEAVIPSYNDSSLAPDGKHIMSISVRYAPFSLAEGDWDSQREILGDIVIDVLTKYAPNIRGLVLDRQIITPLDWQETYGLPEGSIHHGQMGLDQLLVMRPVPGWSRYQTPIDNLYLCGAGTHPGGGVTGIPGYLAAKEVMRNYK